ncbi:uncharacterized protein LOC123229758 isoform X2 [Mangifera indica]|uniref:uncharacterized protein LOC123229758 isoform X2 n=1 Tax=Mangifera indica TaxID=29780 RepID=UPI001CFAD01A|nr:uncharacterized protein LOC123229758 isoform X2 [Mangifera indica]
MAPTLTRLILSPSSILISLSSFRPKPPFLNHQNELLQQNYGIKFRRRDCALLSFLSLMPSLSQPDLANAFSIGISGPKDWLKEQKKKSSKFLLAPIDASRKILNTAYLSLMARESDYTEKELKEVQTMLKSAARDCIPQERNAFVAFQANTGVEVCTFRLIVKNAASLLDDKDPKKLEAEAILDDLISVAGDVDTKLPSSRRQKLADALMDTVASLDKLEQGIKDCLEV